MARRIRDISQFRFLLWALAGRKKLLLKYVSMINYFMIQLMRMKFMSKEKALLFLLGIDFSYFGTRTQQRGEATF